MRYPLEKYDGTLYEKTATVHDVSYIQKQLVDRSHCHLFYSHVKNNSVSVIKCSDNMLEIVSSNIGVLRSSRKITIPVFENIIIKYNLKPFRYAGQ